MAKKLLTESQLEWSTVVANNTMNRERIASGVNSYENEINFNPISFLTARKDQDYIQWTDLCCGTGNALIQAAKNLATHELSKKISLKGIDLVEYFSPYEANDILTLEQMNLNNWQAKRNSDLITIIHGLHYIGDKIGLLTKALSALKEDGLFIGNLDLNNIIFEGIDDSKETLLTFFEKNGIIYNKRKRLLKVVGNKNIKSPFTYLGADDKVGPNYTGQAVVNSHYQLK